MNASSKPLLPTEKFSQLRNPKSIWVERIKINKDLRLCLVFLPWFEASFNTKGETINTTARIIR